MNLVIQKVKDKQYVSFKESYWDPVKKRYSSRTIKNFGRLDLLQKDNPNILEELRAQVEQAKILSDERKELTVKKRVDELSTAKEKVSYADNLSTCLGLTVYWQIWEKLGLQKQFLQFRKRNGIRFDLPRAVFFLLTSRILSPDSKLSFWLNKNQFLFGASNLSLNNLYRAIYVLQEKAGLVLKNINRQIKQGPDSKVTVAIYDLTEDYVGSQAREITENEDASKDRLPIVKAILMLLINEHGIPFDYEVRLCEESGFLSILPFMEEIQNQYKLERVVLAADLGLNNESILELLRALDISYVSFYEVRKGPSSMRNLIQDEKGWISEKSDVQQDYYDVNKYRISRGNRRLSNKEQRSESEKASNFLINYSAKRARKDKEDRLRFSLAGISFLGGIKEERKEKNQEKIKSLASTQPTRRDEVFNGFWGIAYSDANLSAQQVMEIFNSLRPLQKFFRASVSSRGSHWKEKRMKAHILISFLALTIQRYLEWELKQKGLNLSCEAIVEALQKAVLQKIEVNSEESIYCKSFTEGPFEQICEDLGIGRLPTVASEMQVKKALHLRSID